MAGRSLAPAHLAAIALGVCGLGLLVAAFAGAGFDLARLLIGFGLLIAAFLTAGLRLLMGSDPTPRSQEDG